MSLAQVTIIGNLTSDPEVGAMPDGTPTSRFGIAANAKVKGEDVPTFFRVNYIGKVADVANKFLAKGRQTMVQGNLHLEQYVKKDGTPGSSLEVRGTNLQLIGGKVEPKQENLPSGNAGTEEDVPF